MISNELMIIQVNVRIKFFWQMQMGYDDELNKYDECEKWNLFNNEMEYDKENLNLAKKYE